MFVPARYVAEALGAEVEWDETQNKVFILSDKTNNFIRYGLKKKVDFPVVMEAGDVRYTLYDLHIYPVNSNDAKQKIDKFSLVNSEKNPPNYFIWVTMKVENISNHRISIDDPVVEWRIKTRESSGLPAIPGNMHYHDDVFNGTEYLYQYIFNQGQGVTSNEGYYAKDLNYILLLGQGFSKKLAE